VKRLREATIEPLFLALLLLPAAMFPRVLGGGTFFFRDLHLFAFPQRLKVGAALRAGALPFWDATLHAGQPLLANPNNKALYPTALLYALLPAATAFNLEILLHIALAGAGTYLLARSLSQPPVAAFAAGLVYAFSGPILSLTNLLNHHLAAAWTPFVLLFWHRFLTRRTPVWFACAAAAVALQLLAGFPELSLAVAGLLAVWTVSIPAPRSPGIARAGALALLVGAAAGLAAPQVLPAIRLLPETVRGHGIGPASALAWSVDPRRLPELAAPGLFGRVDALSEGAYLGRVIEDEGFPYVLSLAFGAGALALAAFGLRGAGDLRTRHAAALGAYTCGAVALALGRHLPGVGAIIAAFPRFPLRYPEKLVCAAAFPVALLTGAGLARLLEGGRPVRSFARWTAAVAGILGGVAALEAFVPGFRTALAAGLFRLDPGEVPADGVAAAILFAALAAVGIGLAASAACHGWPRSAAALASLAVAAPLIGHAHGLAPVAPRALFDEPAVVADVRTAVGRGILYRVPETGPIHVLGPSDDVAWLARRNVDRLAKYMAAGYGIPIAFHLDFDGLEGFRMSRVARLVESLPWDERVAVLAAAGVAAVLADEPLRAPGLQQVGAPPGLYLYRVAGARPPARLDGAGEAEDVVELSSGPARRFFRTASSKSAALLLTTPYFDGWSASVDGAPAPVRLANGYMQSVSLPAGSHTVELRYRPPGFALGVGLAVLTGAALAVAVARGRRVSAPPG
jgi:hypothetical protein